MNVADRIREIEVEIADINRRLTNIRGGGSSVLDLNNLTDVTTINPERHDVLIYNEETNLWENHLLDLDFEDSIDYAVADIWQALTALIRLEDDLAGDGLIIEDSL